jgi:cyclopropane-fatty-acyl-phospholipid synthase
MSMGPELSQGNEPGEGEKKRVDATNSGGVAPVAKVSLESAEMTRTDFDPQPTSTDQRELLNARGFCGSGRVALPLLARISNLVWDILHKGPAFAFFNFLMTGREPVNPSSIRALVGLVPTALIQLAVRFPSPAKRKALIEDLSKIPLTTGVVGHYDLSNALSPRDTLRVWEIMLGRNGFYSACEFDKRNSSMTLQEAGQKKIESIFSLIGRSGIKISDRTTFADLGCGWGAMVLGAISKGVKPEQISAITTSPHQLEMLRNSNEFTGVKVLDLDIIQGSIPDRHDVILTIGGVEHTPPGRMVEVFKKWSSALNPGGVIVLEFFCDNQKCPLVRFDHPGISQTSLLAQLVFTGATVRDAVHYESAWETADLELVEGTYETLDPHYYSQTMRAWANNLEQHKDEILRMEGGLGVWNHMMTYLVLGEWVFKNKMFETRRVVLRPKVNESE